MNMKFLGVFAAGAMSIAAMPAFAATIFLDDFFVEQTVVDVPTGTFTNTDTLLSSASTTFLGDSRTLTVATGPSVTPIQGNPSGAATFQTFGGNLLFSNNAFC